MAYMYFMKEGLTMMNETREMTSLDIYDINRRAKRVMLNCKALEHMLSKMIQASEGEEDQNGLGGLFKEISRKHAECSADLRAISRLIVGNK